jgi:lipopolysaccharide transport system ATP-binding protein
MREMSATGRTVLFVSHQLGVLARLCTRAIVLAGGETRYDGEAEDAIAFYTASFKDNPQSGELPSEGADVAFGRMLECGVEDEKGFNTGHIFCGANWGVRIRFKVERPLKHAILGIGLTTTTGQPVRNAWSVPQSFDPGCYEAIFKETGITLSAGFYRLNIGFSESERVIHYLEDVAIIQMTDADVTRPRYHTSGAVLNPMNISVRLVEEKSSCGGKERGDGRGL